MFDFQANHKMKVYTVVGNNSTNIKKTNNHLSPQFIEHKQLYTWRRRNKSLSQSEQGK